MYRADMLNEVGCNDLHKMVEQGAFGGVHESTAKSRQSGRIRVAGWDARSLRTSGQRSIGEDQLRLSTLRLGLC